MKRLAARVALAVVLALSVSACASTPQSLPSFKQSLRQYVDSGTYSRQVERVMDRAERFLGRRAPGTTRPAMVLDIDETSLSNWPNQIDSNFCYDPAEFQAWVLLAEADPLPGVLGLYRTATRLGVEVFFVTGRHEDERAATERNLRAVGFESWAALDMRPRHDGEKSAAVFKTAVRRRITDAGYTILLNVGDQESDLAGGYAERSFKLPNPFYEVP